MFFSSECIVVGILSDALLFLWVEQDAPLVAIVVIV